MPIKESSIIANGGANMFKLSLIIAFAVLPILNVVAQEQGRERGGMEAGLFVGNILPNQVPGVDEIHPQGGIRWSFVGNSGAVELALAGGAGNGADWGDFSLSGRMDLPVDVYIAMVYVGIDMIRYQGVGEEMKIFGGGHVGGGLLVPFGGGTGFRLDMKLNANPGTSLLISAGLQMTLGGANTSGAAE